MRQFLFRWRGTLVAGMVPVVLWLGQPTPGWLWLGALMAGAGEMLRLWALGYTGLPTRRSYLDAPALVTAGPYAYVRNPLYLGNLLNGAGVALASSGGLGGWAGPALFACSVGLLIFIYGNIIPLEEEFLLEQHGDCYREYCERVPALLPRLTGAPGGEGSFRLQTALRYEWSTLSWLVVVWGIMLWKVKVALGGS